MVGSSVNPKVNAQHAVAWTAGYGMVDLNERVKDLPKGVELVAALAVADDGAIVVRTNGGLGLLRPRDQHENGTRAQMPFSEGAREAQP